MTISTEASFQQCRVQKVDWTHNGRNYFLQESLFPITNWCPNFLTESSSCTFSAGCYYTLPEHIAAQSYPEVFQRHRLELQLVLSYSEGIRRPSRRNQAARNGDRSCQNTFHAEFQLIRLVEESVRKAQQRFIKSDHLVPHHWSRGIRYPEVSQLFERISLNSSLSSE